MTTTYESLLLDKRKRPEEEQLDTSVLNDPSQADSFLNEYLDDSSSSSKKPRLQEETVKEPLETLVTTEKEKETSKEGGNQQNGTNSVDKGVPIPNYQCKVMNDAELMNPPHGHVEKHLGLIHSFKIPWTDTIGHVVYTGAHPTQPNSTDFEFLQLFLLPRFSSADYYATIQVRIPAEYLLFQSNLAVKARALWGTHVYTDDSDIVAIIIHSGAYTPMDLPTTEDWALGSSVVDPPLPDHDLHVTLRILPRLIRYQGSFNRHISSRSWGSLHDGESLTVVHVEKVEKGSVLKQGRKVGSKTWIHQQASSQKDGEQTILLENDGKAWFLYSKKGLESFKEKLISHTLILESSKNRWELGLEGSQYHLRHSNTKTVVSDTIEWTETGLVMNANEIQVDRFQWKSV